MWAFLKNYKKSQQLNKKTAPPLDANPRSRLRSRPGETLVEVLTAFFILALTASTSTGLTIQSYKTSAVYKRNFQARYSAREVMEYVRMIVNTNAMRFADPECWDTELKEKKCTKSSLKPLAQTGGAERKLALVTYKPEDMNFKLVSGSEPQGAGDGLTNCADGTTPNSAYAIYQKTPSLVDADGKSLDPYGNVLYGTNGTAPSGQSPIFCRRITLSKTDGDNMLIKVEILSKDMKQAKVFQEFINNDAS